MVFFLKVLVFSFCSPDVQVPLPGYGQSFQMYLNLIDSWII